MSRRPDSYYEGLELRLLEMAPLIDALTPDVASVYRDFLDAGEYGLAVEWVAERLSNNTPEADALPALARGLLAEATLMELSPQIRSSLASLAS